MQGLPRSSLLMASAFAVFVLPMLSSAADIALDFEQIASMNVRERQLFMQSLATQGVDLLIDLESIGDLDDEELERVSIIISTICPTCRSTGRRTSYRASSTKSDRKKPKKVSKDKSTRTRNIALWCEELVENEGGEKDVLIQSDDGEKRKLALCYSKKGAK